jgi:hypothetical protein
MSRALGQQVVVENRGGAGGTIATRAVAKTSAGRLHHPADLHRHLGDQSEPLSQRRLRSAQGLRADWADRLAAERAGGSSFAAGAFGRRADRLRQGQSLARSTTPSCRAPVGHIATELFRKTAGIELTKIPYKGNGDALGNLIGGHVSMMVLAIVPIIGNVKAGPCGRSR